MFEPIKNGIQFAKNPIAFLSACQREQGDYYVTRLGGNTVHFVFDPSLARSILNDPLTFKKNKFVYDKIKPITGSTGLVQIEGELGLKLRKAFNTFFKQDALDAYLASARKIIETNVAEFDGTHDVRVLATEMVLGTALSMFAGQPPSAETGQLSRSFLLLNDLCAKEFQNLLPLGNPIRKLQIRTAKKRLDGSIAEVIRSECEPTSLIQSIRDAESQIPMEVTEQFLLNQVKTFLFAGHETTATYLIMALYELSKDLELQISVYEESLDANSKRETTTAFLREILRLYPPAWMIVRESTESGDLEGKPYQKGDYFFIGVHQIHRHPNFWNSAEQLCTANHKEKNIAFLPYGYGKRHCIGSRLADLELKMILEILLARFQLKYAGNPEPIRTKVMITAYPADPVEIEFSKR